MIVFVGFSSSSGILLALVVSPKEETINQNIIKSNKVVLRCIPYQIVTLRPYAVKELILDFVEISCVGFTGLEFGLDGGENDMVELEKCNESSVVIIEGNNLFCAKYLRQ